MQPRRSLACIDRRTAAAAAAPKQNQIEWHQANRKLAIAIASLLILTLIHGVLANWDPYDILGVRRDANQEDIKRAYRDLAKRLHPDKSNLKEEEANRKFIEINKAFNLLKDPVKRQRFDQLGVTDDTTLPNRRGGPGSRQARGEYWTPNGYQTFNFFSSSDNNLRKKSITARQFYNDYLRESKSRPLFIFFYAELCPPCSLIEATWTKITDELAKFNIGSFTINLNHESRLAHDLGVSSIPHIACLLNGQVMHYYQSEISLKSIVRFTRSLLPNNLVKSLESEQEQDKFIALGPQQNRLSAIIIHNDLNLKLRFLLLAFELRQHYRFGHISTKSSSYQQLEETYKLEIDTDGKQSHLLVFDEDISSPVRYLNIGPELSDDFVNLKRELTKWPFLQLPKLSSQQMFDDLCLNTKPREFEQHSGNRLCSILFTKDIPATLPTRTKLREFIKQNGFAQNERVVFAFLDILRQADFVRNLLQETKDDHPFEGDQVENFILLLERQKADARKAYHRWIPYRWDSSKLDELDRAKLDLYSTISQYLEDPAVLKGKLVLATLVDEEAPGLAERIYRRLLDSVPQVLYYLTSPEYFTIVAVLVVCTLMAHAFFNWGPMSLPRARMFAPEANGYSKTDSYERTYGRQQQPASQTRPFESSNRYQTTGSKGSESNEEEDDPDSMKIIELKAETYNGMIRLLKPGYRTIVLLTDQETKDRLLPEFKKAVWPYRRNKTLLFGYLCLDRNFEWYKSLLEEILGQKSLNVNKKKCVGTVLSLNGFKKYFRVYHAKHNEVNHYQRESVDQPDEDDDGSSFLGFNDRDGDQEAQIGIISRATTDEAAASKMTRVENLLAKLPIWLDKMFDGLTKRYFVDKWPEEIN